VLKLRVIPCLDVAGTTVVKGQQFGNLVPFDDPAVLAERYEAQGADEVVVLDITAGVEHRSPDPRLIRRVASRLSVPVTVGGGIATVEAAAAMLAAGADKVTVNSAALARPDLVEEIARRFGRQAVVVAVDVRRESGDWRVYAAGGRRPTPWMLRPWLETVEALGAGEVLLTSIDRDGTGTGYDLEALAQATAATTVPLVASGGAGHVGHLAEAAQISGVTGVLLAGMLHRGETTVQALKQALSAQGVTVRV
jgi:cyclase